MYGFGFGTTSEEMRSGGHQKKKTSEKEVRTSKVEEGTLRFRPPYIIETATVDGDTADCRMNDETGVRCGG